MSARIIDGTAAAKRLRQEIAEKIAKHKVTPGLAVVLVGEDPASQVYVRNKGRAAEEVGMKSWTHRLPADVTQKQLLDLVDSLNKDPAVHVHLWCNYRCPNKLTPKTSSPPSIHARMSTVFTPV